MDLYSTLYDLINKFVFDYQIIPNSMQDLAVTLVSTIGWLFVVSLPFVIVYKVICLIVGGVK